MTGEMAMRLARREDVPIIVSMLRDDILGSRREADEAAIAASYYEAFDEIMRSPCSKIHLAEIGGEVVGMFQLDLLRFMGHQGARVAQIESVRVRGDLRGRGIGRRMMLWVIEEARRRGCRRLQLTTHEARVDAHRFYRALGFEETHLGMKLAL